MTDYPMKKLLLLIITLLSIASVQAQDDTNKAILTLKNNTTRTFNTANVSSIDIDEAGNVTVNSGGQTEVFTGNVQKIHFVKKAETIFKWLAMFAKYHKNDKLFRNPNVAHALCRFYDKFSTKTKDFKAALAKSESNPKIDVKNAKAIVEGMGIGKKQTEEAELAAAEAATEPAMVTA